MRRTNHSSLCRSTARLAACAVLKGRTQPTSRRGGSTADSGSTINACSGDQEHAYGERCGRIKWHSGPAPGANAQRAAHRRLVSCIHVQRLLLTTPVARPSSPCGHRQHHPAMAPLQDRLGVTPSSPLQCECDVRVSQEAWIAALTEQGCVLMPQLQQAERPWRSRCLCVVAAAASQRWRTSSLACWPTWTLTSEAFTWAVVGVRRRGPTLLTQQGLRRISAARSCRTEPLRCLAPRPFALSRRVQVQNRQTPAPESGQSSASCCGAEHGVRRQAVSRGRAFLPAHGGAAARSRGCGACSRAARQDAALPGSERAVRQPRVGAGASARCHAHTLRMGLMRCAAHDLATTCLDVPHGRASFVAWARTWPGSPVAPSSSSNNSNNKSSSKALARRPHRRHRRASPHACGSPCAPGHSGPCCTTTCASWASWPTLQRHQASRLRPRRPTARQRRPHSSPVSTSLISLEPLGRVTSRADDVVWPHHALCRWHRLRRASQGGALRCGRKSSWSAVRACARTPPASGAGGGVLVLLLRAGAGAAARRGAGAPVAAGAAAPARQRVPAPGGAAAGQRQPADQQLRCYEPGPLMTPLFARHVTRRRRCRPAGAAPQAPCGAGRRSGRQTCRRRPRQPAAAA